MFKFFYIEKYWEIIALVDVGKWSEIIVCVDVGKWW
jgi:hypothetical protein